MSTIHPKVFASTIGSGIGGTLSAFVLWILGVTVWGTSASAVAADQAITAVPLPVAAVVALVITVGATFGGGWLAKSTPELSAIIESYEPDSVAGAGNPAAAEADPAIEADPGEPAPEVPAAPVV